MKLERSQIRHQFSRAAKNYDRYAVLQQRVLRHVVSLLPRENIPVLDIGAGTGFLAELVAHERDVIAIDIALPMCRQARARTSYVINAAAEALPIASGMIDLAVSSLCLQWVEAHLFFSEMQRVLKPGGVAVIASFGPRTLHELKHALEQQDGQARVHTFADITEMAALANASGLCIDAQKTEEYRENYPSFTALLAAIKGIGATHAAQGRSRNFLRRDTLKAAAQLYQRQYGHDKYLPATWEVYYLVLRKEK